MRFLTPNIKERARAPSGHESAGNGYGTEEVSGEKRWCQCGLLERAEYVYVAVMFEISNLLETKQDYASLYGSRQSGGRITTSMLIVDFLILQNAEDRSSVYTRG